MTRVCIIFGSQSVGPIELPAVPRVGEVVMADGKIGRVHDVQWNILPKQNIHEVRVYLEPVIP